MLWDSAGADGRAGSDTLIIHHNGHGPCNGGEPARKTDCTDCTPNFDTAQDWLNQLGTFSVRINSYNDVRRFLVAVRRVSIFSLQEMCEDFEQRAFI